MLWLEGAAMRAEVGGRPPATAGSIPSLLVTSFIESFTLLSSAVRETTIARTPVAHDPIENRGSQPFSNGYNG